MFDIFRHKIDMLFSILFFYLFITIHSLSLTSHRIRLISSQLRRLISMNLWSLTISNMFFILSYFNILSTNVTSFRSRSTLFLMSNNIRKWKWIQTIFTLNRSFWTILDMFLKLSYLNRCTTILATFFSMELILF